VKRKYQLATALFAVMLLTGAGYYFVTPKATISNLSSLEYDEFVVTLPSSRIVFGPVEANSASTIFYSRQDKSGIAEYLLRDENDTIASDTFPYAEGSELGRVLRFTIQNDGQMSVEY